MQSIQNLHCRVGSSESDHAQPGHLADLHCRVGSSENERNDIFAHAVLHCRIGSSTPLHNRQILHSHSLPPYNHRLPITSPKLNPLI